MRRMHAILHAALTRAVRRDLIVSNPADRIEPPKPGKSRRKAPPDEPLQAILAAAGDDMICYLRLAAVTGARRGQIVALRWRDIDLDAATVTFTTALARVKGGTDLDWWHGWHLRVVPRGARETSPGRPRAQPRARSRVVVWRADRGLARPAATAAYAMRETVAGSTRPVRADDPLGRPPSGRPRHHQLVAHVDDTGRVPGVVTSYPLGDRRVDLAA